MTKSMPPSSRRRFLRVSFSGLASAVAAPTIVPSSVFGANAPSNRIQVGAIGMGRICRDHDLPETVRHESARVVAVCDLDKKRMAEGKQFVENLYAKKGVQNHGVKACADYRELLADKGIDAVLISTPDHWHAKPAIEAAWAGKDIYLQKPASLTLAEGRQMSDAVHRTGRIFQLGTQQRSMEQFRRACELVRNGRIGKVHTVKIGLPIDPSGEVEPETPVPPNLNYEMWLGSTPYVYYTEKRVHPQQDYSRPGWLRCEQFGAGMITGWGVHHVDIAHWALGFEYTGPLEILAKAEFPTRGLWDVHGKYQIEAHYQDGVTFHISDELPNGVRFEGSAGWIFVTRGDYSATGSDPGAPQKKNQALTASDPKILTSVVGPEEIQFPRSDDHHKNWLESIRSRKPPLSPAEEGHRSTSTCLVCHIGMKLKRRLTWNPRQERFLNDDEANSMLSRPERWPWGIQG